jgi:hypothetical protein
MPKVKILVNFKEAPHDLGNHLGKDGRRWNDIQVTDDEKADYFLILNHPGRARYIPERAVVMQMEPAASRAEFPFPFNRPECYRKRFLYVFDTASHHNAIEWHISPSYSDFINGRPDLKKTKSFSAVISGLNYLEGYKKRLTFLKKIAEIFPVDIYGRGHSPGFFPEGLPGRYLGEITGPKDEGLFLYKYTFAAENTREFNYFTEKICDAILAECLAFYWGCPNLSDFIDPRAYIALDPDDHAKSIETIKNAIENDEWSKRLPYIRQAKEKILNELQIFPTLEKILRQAEKNGLPPRRYHFLPPRREFHALQLKERIQRRIKKIVKRITYRLRIFASKIPRKRPSNLIIIVPYRDRAENLKKFAPAMHAHLKDINHQIIVVEQAGEELFNRGKLFNVGFDLFKNEDAYFCFHDVDLLPESTACDYSSPPMPTHMALYLPQCGCEFYPKHFGGVVLFNKADFTRVNGYSNEYWGWDGEDDDLLLRIKLSWQIPWATRPGRYRSLEHIKPSEYYTVHEEIKRASNPNYHRNLARLGNFKQLAYDPKSEGLNSLNYRVIDQSFCDGYVKFTVSI